MKSAINLLPTTFRRQVLVRRRAIQWGAVLCVVLSAIWAARSYKLREYHALSQQLEAVAREGRPAQTMLQEITSMRDHIDNLQQHEAVAKELEQQRPVLTLLSLLSQAAGQRGGKLRVVEFRAVDLQSTHTEGARGAEESKNGTVTLVGVSLDSPTVAEFHDALMQSGLFQDVKLIKSNEREENGLALYDYEVCCEL